jgi:ATP-binding cassette subfamily B (MDR/TAP) protein 1
LLAHLDLINLQSYLTEHFYDLLSDSVMFDRTDLRELNINWLHSQIGLVSQEPVLFMMTIRGNITHDLIGTQYEDLTRRSSTHQSSLRSYSFISRLPLWPYGWWANFSVIGRAKTACAIVSDPHILLLDEITNVLDTRSEVIVQDALNKAAAG